MEGIIGDITLNLNKLSKFFKTISTMFLCFITIISFNMAEIIGSNSGNLRGKSDVNKNNKVDNSASNNVDSNESDNGSNSSTIKGREDNKLIVIIDPGHGGGDPGKIGSNNILEKNINLSVALEIKNILVKKNIEVILTRESDCGLYGEDDRNKKRSDLEKRCSIVNEQYINNKNTICVSIHQNSYQNESVSGPQVFYYVKSQKGEMLAQIIQDEINDKMQIQNRRVQKANDNYYLLVNTMCPTVIVECGFLSNVREAELLCDDKYQQKIAFAIVSGIIKYQKET